MTRTKDEQDLAEAVTRLNEDVNYFKRQVRWYKFATGVLVVFTFFAMYVVRAYYSAESQREIVCARAPAEPCDDHVAQYQASFDYRCPHPNQDMTVREMHSAAGAYVIILCTCKK